jgi:hemoglobin
MANLFERLGGKPAVDRFYEKVLRDDRIRHFFENVDMARQGTRQKAFLSYAFGGLPGYAGKSMTESHAHLVKRGLDDSHVDAVIENLGATLREMGVAEDLIKEVALVAESTRNDVLGRGRPK